jgi:hypothetical protein
MNKKSKTRASFVFTIICLLYVVVTFRINDKLSMTRASSEQIAPIKGNILPLPSINSVKSLLPSEGARSCTTVSEVPQARVDKEPSTPVAPTAAVPQIHSAVSSGGFQCGIEPSLLIAVPVISYAIGHKWLEPDSLILAKKDAYNNVSWRKPIDILKDRDEEGLVNILNTIGQKRVVEFLKSEGIDPGNGLSTEDIVLGRGYKLEQSKLIALYDKHVGNRWDDMFPFNTKTAGIVKNAGGFKISKSNDTSSDLKQVAVEKEWSMPNVTNLPLRLAVEKVAAYTSRIKVYGSGRVVNQSPNPFERLKGEKECVIQGRIPAQ